MIKILNPDVNESGATYSVNKNGDVRYALTGIKGFGANIVEAILKEREENGLFTDIYDFVERINLNRKAFEVLLYSGALDSFGYKRRQFELPGRSGEPFLDEITRYADLFHRDTVDAGASLFGDVEEMRPERPVIPEMSGEEDVLAFLQKEKELVGMFLSSHPLDRYSFEINNFTTCNLVDLPALVNDCEAQKKQVKVLAAGIITDVKLLTTRTGKPYSRTMIEDYSGSYELSLFGKDHEAFLQYMKPHECLFLEGEVGEKFFLKPEERAQGKTSPYAFKLKKVSLLGNLSENMLSGFGFDITTPMITPDFKENLVRVIRRHRGNIPLTMNLFDPDTRYRIQFYSRKFQVSVTTELIDDLRRIGISKYDLSLK